MTIANHRQQPGHPERGKVVVVTRLPGALVGIAEVTVEHVVAQCAPAAAVHRHPAAVPADPLQPQVHRVPTRSRREQSVRRAAADPTDTRAAIVLVDEVTQIGAQHPVTHRLFVQQIEIALLIDIRQLRMPCPHLGTLLIETVLSPRVVESIGGHARRRPRRQILHVRRIAQAHGPVLPRLQPQTFNLPGHQHGATEGLRQQSPIVVTQHRNIRQQFANLHFRLRKTGLGRQPCPAKIVCRATIAVHRQQFGAAGHATAVELDPKHGNPFQAKTHRPRGVTGAEFQNKALRPFIHLAFACAVVTKITIEVVVAQHQIGLRTVKKPLILGHCLGTHRQRQQTCKHLHYYCSPIFGRSRSPQLRQPAQTDR